MSKKKKIIVLASMVALLVLTGCLNYFLNRPSSDSVAADSNVVTYSDYFTASRNDRTTSRNETVMYYRSIIDGEATSAEAKANAEAELAALVAGADSEQRLETLIKSLGYDDCIVTVGKEKINVIVKSDSLTEQEAAQLLDMVCTETGKGVGHIRVKSIEM